MVWIVPIIYLLVNLIHAKYHAYLADKKNKTITSKQKIFEYSLVSFILFWILLGVNGKLLPVGSGWEPLPLILFPILTRTAFFDTALNKFRGKNWLYEGEIKRKKSWTDWLENKIGLPTWVYRIVYIVLYIVYLVIYFNER